MATSILQCKCPAGTFLDQTGGECASCPQAPYRAAKARGETQASACTCNASYVGLREFAGICGCEDGQYMDHVRRACQKCSTSEKCIWGTNLNNSLQQPQVKAGFWAEPAVDMSSFAGSSIWRCASPQSCLENGQCAEGRHGPACGLCEPGTTGSPDGDCQPCSGDITKEDRRWLLALGILLGGVPAIILLHVGLTDESDSLSILMQLRAVRGSVKQMVKHLQTVTIIGGLSVNWPPIALSFFEVLQRFTVNVPTLLAAACLKDQTSATFEMTMKWCMPPVFALVALLAMPTSRLLAWLLRSLPCRRGGRLSRMAEAAACQATMTLLDVARVLLFSLTLFWSTLAANSFEMLTCMPSPNGRLTVATYPHVVCDLAVPEFLTVFFASFATIVLYLFLPLWVLYNAYQKSNVTLASSLRSDRGWFAFLFDDFRDGHLFWLVIIMAKDALFVLIPAALPGQGAAQLFLTAAAAAAHGCMVMHSFPFHDRSNCMLEAWNAASSAVLCLYSAGMGYEQTAGMSDVEELFQDGNQDPIYRGRAIGMVVVQVIAITVPSFVLLFQLLCAVRRTREMLPRRVKPLSQEDSEEWLHDFLTDAGVTESELANVLWKLDDTDMHFFRSFIQTTSATMGECLARRSSCHLVQIATRIHSERSSERSAGSYREFVSEASVAKDVVDKEKSAEAAKDTAEAEKPAKDTAEAEKPAKAPEEPVEKPAEAEKPLEDASTDSAEKEGSSSEELKLEDAGEDLEDPAAHFLGRAVSI